MSKRMKARAQGGTGKSFEFRNPMYSAVPEEERKRAKSMEKKQRVEEDEKAVSTFFFICLFGILTSKTYVPQALSKKLLKQAREQQMEENEMYVIR